MNDKTRGNWMSRLALRFCDVSERWFPDAYIFAVLAVFIVAAATLFAGAPVTATAKAFGDGFWGLIPFTMQMCFILIGGHVVASSPPATRLIEVLVRWPRNGRSAVGMVAAFSMLVSLLHWGLALIVGALLVKALGRREDLAMDYRAASAAGYLGTGSIWAMGLSSSAAQLQANAASMSKELLAITGVIPFSETIFLWQSLVLTVLIFALTLAISIWSAPADGAVKTARSMGIDIRMPDHSLPPITRPIEALERSPFLNLLLFALGAGWLLMEFGKKGFVGAIASLNTYNFLFLMLGLLLQWRPRRFLDAAYAAVPATAGILIQYPLYAGIAMMLTSAKSVDGVSVAQHLSNFFTSVATTETYPLVIGSYSAFLGLFVPSGGGKWLIEAPYVMQAANDLKVHLGWAVQVYNAAEALPNLVNPLFMLPLLGIVGLKTRDIIGYTFLQFLIHLPIVLLLLWLLGLTLDYHPPVMPAP